MITVTIATQTITNTADAYEGKTVELNGTGNLKAGDTITVNGKTYEFTDDTSKAVGSGNIAVSLGSDGNKTLENLSKQLAEDGVTHTLDKSNSAHYKLVFNNKDYTGGESFNQLNVSIND